MFEQRNFKKTRGLGLFSLRLLTLYLIANSRLHLFSKYNLNILIHTELKNWIFICTPAIFHPGLIFVTLFASRRTNSTTCPDLSGLSFRSSNPKSYVPPPLEKSLHSNHSVSNKYLSTQNSRREKPQKAPPPVKGAGNELFYGQSLRQKASASLYYTPRLHFVPPPFVTFHSLSASNLGYPRKSASHSFLIVYATRRFIPLPLAFLSHVPKLKAKTGSSISPNAIRYFAFSQHPCFSQPNQRNALQFKIDS